VLTQAAYDARDNKAGCDKFDNPASVEKPKVEKPKVEKPKVEKPEKPKVEKPKP
jgi:hypothetical protein